jgi:hypothetical protein
MLASTPLRRGLAAGVAGLMLACAGPALADWRRAETPNFIIYSDGSEGQLRDYAVQLETYDFVLRAREGRMGEETFRKLPIYVVRGRGQFEEAVGRLEAAGVYSVSDEDIFAVAIRGDGDDTLLHEYFHHFSFQAGRLTAAPGWLVEGLAEYYMTAEIRSDRVTIGSFNEGRAYVLTNLTWLPWRDLLTKRRGEFRRDEAVASFYAQSWLLTHWFLSDPARRETLNAYVQDLAGGADPLEAFEARVGMDVEAFGQTMRRYLNARRLTGTRYEFTPVSVEVAITRLPPSADDLLLLGQRLKIGTPTAERAALAERVRRIAARYPDDPFALLQLGHAELHFGDADVGETVLTRLLEIEPGNVEALQLMATRRLRQARETDEDPARLLSQARGYLARAYAVDEYDYRTLNLIAESRQGVAGYPNDNDVTVLEQAFALAPQLSGTRVQLAQAYMVKDRFEEAQALLRPIANAPHGGGLAEYAQRLLEDAEAGRPPSAPPETVEEDEAL